MEEALNKLICEAILAAMGQHLNPTEAAEKAARAFAAGRAAFNATVTQPASQPSAA